jgi:hypothetical protein
LRRFLVSTREIKASNREIKLDFSGDKLLSPQVKDVLRKINLDFRRDGDIWEKFRLSRKKLETLRTKRLAPWWREA